MFLSIVILFCIQFVILSDLATVLDTLFVCLSAFCQNYFSASFLKIRRPERCYIIWEKDRKYLVFGLRYQGWCHSAVEPACHFVAIALITGNGDNDVGKELKKMTEAAHLFVASQSCPRYGSRFQSLAGIRLAKRERDGSNCFWSENTYIVL